MPELQLSVAPELLLGPLSGLIISLFFCYRFLVKFEKTTERLVSAFESELEVCNRRYNYILTELMKLKHRN